MNVLEKVKKLLRLGESPNANESAAAIAKAHALMEEHGIRAEMLRSETESTEPEEEVRDFADPLHVGKRYSSWRGRLAMTLGEACGCQIFKRRGDLMIIGRPTDAVNLRVLFSFCAAEIDALVRAEARGNGKSWINNFRLGCVDAISRSIAEERDRLRAKLTAEATDQRALVVVENAIAKHAQRYDAAVRYGKTKLRLRSGGRSGGRYDAGARAAGQRAGRGIYASSKGSRRITG